MSHFASRPLRYAPAPVDNPLKGLVPYEGDVRRFFPHSMEFNYLPVSAVVQGPREYNWDKLEALLDRIASRGHQTIFRFWLEYPELPSGIPVYLVKDGLKVTHWRDANAQPPPTRDQETPDYNDPRLRKMLQDFIVALGKRYDGDRRIGYITAGLLGSWGEWHTYPRTDLWASKAVQQEVIDAYAQAFKTTPVLLRYPANGTDADHAANDRAPFGYHDDSFAWATLDTGRKEDSWFFLPALRHADAASKWQREPIGGEIRPETWGRIFDAEPGIKDAQDFARCVQETHATWLMDSGMFKENPPERRARAEVQVRRMGYEFHVPRVTLASAGKSQIMVLVAVENRGVAPFYYPWAIEWQLHMVGGQARTVRGRQALAGLLPGEKPRVWSQGLDTRGLRPGSATVAVRVVNPLPNGLPLRFANQEQRPDGWLTLGTVDIV